MSSTIPPPPPREQLCTRSCSNKSHTLLTKVCTCGCGMSHVAFENCDVFETKSTKVLPDDIRMTGRVMGLTSHACARLVTGRRQETHKGEGGDTQGERSVWRTRASINFINSPFLSMRGWYVTLPDLEYTGGRISCATPLSIITLCRHIHASTTLGARLRGIRKGNPNVHQVSQTTFYAHSQTSVIKREHAFIRSLITDEWCQNLLDTTVASVSYEIEPSVQCAMYPN